MNKIDQLRLEYLYEKEEYKDLAKIIDKEISVDVDVDMEDAKNLLVNKAIKLSEIQSEIRAIR